MRDHEQKKKSNWLPILVLLFIFVPELVIFVAVFGVIAYVIYTNSKKDTTSNGKTTYSQKKLTLDDLICFHKDKGEHHVSRGKEMDPWDRPDIDISKYQRKR